MKISQVLFAAFLSSAASAAPAAASKSMMATDTQWTITHMVRNCNSEDTQCTWNFGIDANGSNTGCTLVVNGSHASQANGGPVTCGDYTVTSGWSGQFGAGNGFTTLSVVDQKTRQIIWPAYTDKQLASGQPVSPDQSYTPSNLP